MTTNTQSPEANALAEESNMHSPAGAQLLDKIRTKHARVAVVGLGYVGLPLASAIHDAGFPVIGFDVDVSKVKMLAAGQTYLKHLGADMVTTLSASDRFTPTSDERDIADADIVILCVPTPLGVHNEPDLSYVIGSTEIAARVLRAGQLIVLESTTYPGTTRDEMVPILSEAAEKKGLDHAPGTDFFVAYSPEREDPGRAGMTTSSIPKLVGGIDPESGILASVFYRSFIQRVHDVANAEVAEAAKLLENIYRAVNIALVNELKVVFDRMGIDIWEVIDAAKTKPFGFQAFYPGPGLGGHCIPIDPFYLTWKAKEVGYATRFIELAGEVNKHMPRHVVGRVMDALNDDGKSLRGSSILVIGLAYKPNVDDMRESPAAEIVNELYEKGASVRYHDPHIPEFPPMRKYKFQLGSVPLAADEIANADCVLIVTDHDDIDWSLIGRSASLVVDTRNAMARATGVTARVVKA